MKKVAERDGIKYYKFEDKNDLYDYTYKEFHKMMSERRGEDVHIPDWIIQVAFDTILDSAEDNDLVVPYFFISKVFKSVAENINESEIQ